MVTEIAASPDAVWDAITTPGGLANWFPTEAEVKPGIGGQIIYNWAPDIVGVCRIEAWDPPRHLRTSWLESTGSDGARLKAPAITFSPLARDLRVEARGRRVLSTRLLSARWIFHGP